MKPYKLFKDSDFYDMGIFDNCSDALFIRSDGLRLRLETDSVEWKGGSGSYQRLKRYIDGRQNVKSFIRNLRKRTIQAIKFGFNPNSHDILTGDCCYLIS